MSAPGLAKDALVAIAQSWGVELRPFATYAALTSIPANGTFVRGERLPPDEARQRYAPNRKLRNRLQLLR